MVDESYNKSDKFADVSRSEEQMDLGDQKPEDVIIEGETVVVATPVDLDKVDPANLSLLESLEKHDLGGNNVDMEDETGPENAPLPHDSEDEDMRGKDKGVEKVR